VLTGSGWAADRRRRGEAGRDHRPELEFQDATSRAGGEPAL